MYFQKPGRKSEKNLEEILKFLKTWEKFRKPGKNFQKSFGHPVKRMFYCNLGGDLSQKLNLLILFNCRKISLDFYF